MNFHKYHGQGNDFLIVWNTDVVAETGDCADAQAELARAMCCVHYGIGADGLMAVQRSSQPEADFQMTLWNADGGRAEMSGNGIRCLAAFLRQTGEWTAGDLRINTDAGIKTLRLHSHSGYDFQLEVEIGAPRLSPEQIPVRLDAPPPLLDVPIVVGGQEIRATLTSMGNPHCSIFFEMLEPRLVHELGPQLENHPLFPARTNVEFVSVINSERVRVLFWERGAGPTLSSGTGSCAAAVAAMLRGAVGRTVCVETPAGELGVSWPEGGIVTLTGPARYVFRGEWPSHHSRPVSDGA